MTWAKNIFFTRNPENKNYPGYLFHFLFAMAEKFNASYILFQNDSLTKAYGSGKLPDQVEQMKKNGVDIALISVPFYTDLGKYFL